MQRTIINMNFGILFLLLSLFCGDFLWAKKQISPLEDEDSISTVEMPGYILKKLKDDPYIKEHFGWKIAIGQHPMYLLIDEDRGKPTVGERIPPWGAETASGYVERIVRNLKSLEDYPDLRLNYQWSAYELNELAQNFPEVFEKIKAQYEQKKLDFLDGTYSQAHLQILSSESNWRQFEYGQKIYTDLISSNVDLYARQETGFHLQLPQLLKKFNYKFASTPAFHASIEIQKGPFEFITQEGTFETLSGNGFVNMAGLDGSLIPTYLNITLGWGNIPEERELSQDLFSMSKIIGVFPDMDEIEKETFEHYYALFDWVLLNPALHDLFKAEPPQVEATISSYWSYSEGVWAEELLRNIKRAEELAILTEQICCMGKIAGLDIDKNEELTNIWKTILKSQHHDISWIEVTDLRRKSIEQLAGAMAHCKSLMREIGNGLIQQDKNYISLFNGLSRSRKCIIELENGKGISGKTFQKLDSCSIGIVNLQSGGYESFLLTDSIRKAQTGKPPRIFNTKHYTIEFSDQYLIKQITEKGGRELLSADEYLGGEIRARIKGEWVNNRSAIIDYKMGPVFDYLERRTTLGNIPLREKYLLFKDIPVVKVELEFEFNGDEVGYFWIDESKINVYYPTEGNEIYYDIPFGHVKGIENRPLFPINWLYTGGLVYVNRGTVKHWVRNGTIANVIGWGGNHFSNRLHWDWLESPQFDIRLYGSQKIEYYILPVGEFNGLDITNLVSDLITPTFQISGRGSGSFYATADSSLIFTSIYEKRNEIWTRGYQHPAEGKREYNNWEIFNRPLTQ